MTGFPWVRQSFELTLLVPLEGRCVEGGQIDPGRRETVSKLKLVVTFLQALLLTLAVSLRMFC